MKHVGPKIKYNISMLITRRKEENGTFKIARDNKPNRRRLTRRSMFVPGKEAEAST